AGLLAKVGEQSEMARHVDAVIAAAAVPLRGVEKKTPSGGPTSGRPGDHGDDAVLLATGAVRPGTRP
ncbi:MAG: hypothetical protein ACLQGP_28390, partial [Isosphaeraceae bacterium]